MIERETSNQQRFLLLTKSLIIVKWSIHFDIQTNTIETSEYKCGMLYMYKTNTTHVGTMVHPLYSSIK